MRRERPRLDDSPLLQSFARIAQLIANEQEQVVATQRAGMVAPAEAGMIAPAEEGMIAPAEEEGETEAAYGRKERPHTRRRDRR